MQTGEGVSMGSFPYGPHGPECSSYDVKPNLTAPGPVSQFEQSTFSDAPVNRGGGSGALANIIVSLLLVVILWIPCVGLYPLTALVPGETPERWHSAWSSRFTFSCRTASDSAGSGIEGCRRSG
jgi:hypothetical protein